MPWHGAAEQAADLRRGVMRFMDMLCWKCLPSLYIHIYLFLKNLRACKAPGFILALSFLQSLTLWLQAKLDMWLESAVHCQQQLPLRPDPHLHVPPRGFS